MKNDLERKKNQELYFSNPKIEIINKIPTGVGESLFVNEGVSHTLYPVYPESKGITSNWIYHKIVEIFKSGVLDTLIDPIPKEILDKYNLPSLKTALIWIHTPMKSEDAHSARKRFAFQEVFFIQLEKQIQRKHYEMNPSFTIQPDDKHLQEFIADKCKDKLKSEKPELYKLYTRKEPTKEAKLFIIFCEGQNTEPMYFRYFQNISHNINLEIIEQMRGKILPDITTRTVIKD
jgi:hypothetical protein